MAKGGVGVDVGGCVHACLRVNNFKKSLFHSEIFESDNEDSPSLYDSDNNVSEDSAPEQPQQVITVGVKPRPRLRGRQPKRR